MSITDPAAGSGAAWSVVMQVLPMEGAPLAVTLASPASGGLYVVDTSVWARMSTPAVAARVADVQARHTIAVVTPQVLELGFSASSPDELDRVHEAMATFPVLHPTPATHELALAIQVALWRGGKVRAAGAFDTLIAAITVEHDATVLHYDRDFEHIAAVLPGFKQEVVAPFGSIA